MDINECSFSVLLKLYMSEYSKVTGKKYSQGLIAECINVSRKDFCISINKDIEEMSSRVLYGLYDKYWSGIL